MLAKCGAAACANTCSAFGLATFVAHGCAATYAAFSACDLESMAFLGVVAASMGARCRFCPWRTRVGFVWPVVGDSDNIGVVINEVLSFYCYFMRVALGDRKCEGMAAFAPCYGVVMLARAEYGSSATPSYTRDGVGQPQSVDRVCLLMLARARPDVSVSDAGGFLSISAV